MIVNSLKIKNFRQFVGEHIITFSTDPNKKVTIIIAESGVGKTTLIQCFQWILYGTSKYKNPLNSHTKQQLLTGEDEVIECSINISHKDNEYTITRKQIFRKQNVKVISEDSILTVDVKDNNGVTQQKRGKEASKIIKEIMHMDLFPYFFLEGESLTKVGEQMSKGKAGSNSEFVKAIKGLLGFNHLYEAKKHLKLVSAEYHTEIEKHTNDVKLKQILKDIEDSKSSIHTIDLRLENIDNEIQYYKEKRDEVNAKILQFSEVEVKQKRRSKIENIEIPALLSRIQEQRKCIMRKFSSQGIYLVMNSLIPLAEKTLENSDCLDKGIPGINVEAVEYMLNTHKCICGHELVEGSKEWEKLNDWLAFLPPNNIGYEIDSFTSEIKRVKKSYTNFTEDFEKLRKDYAQLLKQYNNLVEEKNILDEEIQINEDISKLKEQERGYEQKVIDLSAEKKIKVQRRAELQQRIEQLEEQRKQFKILDEKVQKLNLYYNESEILRKQIERFCERKENEKRKALEEAINKIFKDFYVEKIEFRLDENYGVQIKTFDAELSEDFTSGGQDVAVALAFIGAIIKLIREKDNDPENIMDDDNGEEYPLVMDAPTSNFGMKQMKSFCDIMPKITEQIIVFINDKDGPILKDQMYSQIGSEWTLIKNDTYHSEIREVK